jgi:PAS domain S-box-containing protein
MRLGQQGSYCPVTEQAGMDDIASVRHSLSLDEKRGRDEEMLDDVDDSYRSLFQNLPIGVLRSTMDGRFLDSNPACLQMLGCPNLETLLKHNAAEFYANADDRTTWKKIIEVKGFVRGHEVQFRRLDGALIWVRISVRAIRDAEGRILCVEGTLEDITSEKLAEKELENSRERCLTLSAHLQSVREQERMSIAREIHDEFGQAFSALKMDLSWLEKRISRDRKAMSEKINSMTKLIDTTIQTLQKICAELRPALLDDLGLEAAMEWQGEDFQKRTGIRCELRLATNYGIFHQDFSTVLFRIFQETLMNVARHAGATIVRVSLAEKGGEVALKIQDNGRGITEEQIFSAKSLGIMGMRERVEHWKGKLKISGIPNKGTTVEISFPVLKEQPKSFAEIGIFKREELHDQNTDR